ncbi:MAG: ABC transporter [Ponticaulis sp.]|nr:ABC transporter [Ponticaulis sp.]|tara:strand:+ start:24975 stop:26570 length:1596 start_codon:yes stop_codon:yes gene_type:complete
MTISLTLNALSAARPDGSPLFSDLTLSLGSERIGVVGRNGAGKSTLFNIIQQRLAPVTGTVTCHGRIGELRQVTPDTDTLAHALGIATQLDVLARIEAGQGDEADFAAADWTLPDRCEQILRELGLGNVSLDRLTASMSGGERTRLELARIWLEDVDLLLLDEPTNNLDRAGRQAIYDLIANDKRGMLIASHDRELLEGMDRILHLSTAGITLVSGGWSEFADHRRKALETSHQQKAQAEREIAQTQRELQSQKEKKDRRAQSGKKLRASGSQPKMATDALKQGAENAGSREARLKERRLGAAQDRLATARERIERLTPLTIELPDLGFPAGRMLAELKDVTLKHGTRRLSSNLSARFETGSRWAIRGSNGSGKTSLIRCICGEDQPHSGEILRAPYPIAWLDQHISLLSPDLSLMENLLQAHPDRTEGEAHEILARFAFRNTEAHRLAGTLSGGERMRAGLAVTFNGIDPPQLLILDEPTNHLDVESIETLEAALQTYTGGLLVVSHDDRFLETIGCNRTIELGSDCILG